VSTIKKRLGEMRGEGEKRERRGREEGGEMKDVGKSEKVRRYLY
jgi:hypothetical protein